MVHERVEVVDDNEVQVDDEVEAVGVVHGVEEDNNEVLVDDVVEVAEVREQVVAAHGVEVDDNEAEVDDEVVAVGVVHGVAVVGDSADDAQVEVVEVHEQVEEVVHDGPVHDNNMDSNSEVEVHGRPTQHSPRRQVQLLTPLKKTRIIHSSDIPDFC